MRSCDSCGGALHPAARADARYCSTRCRVRVHRARRLPAELTGRDRWVRRLASKVPVTASGTPASSTDPATWCSYREASASTVGVGLGFVLDGDGIVCLDLDHCLVDGELTGRAAEILAMCPDTFVEVSPSGDGLHVWGWGNVPEGRKLDGCEVYGTGRYITVTGDRWKGSPAVLADLSEVVASLL